MPESQTFTRFYFQLSSLANSNILAIGRNAIGGGIYTIFTPNNSLTANAWHYVELQDTETTNGTAQVWLDGTSINSVNADFSTSAPYARLMLFDGVAGTFYFDNVRVTNTYNGSAAQNGRMFADLSLPATPQAAVMDVLGGGAASMTVWSS